MIATVVIFCAALAASGANLINTGSSVSSRVMDGHGNYAFEYGIASNGAKRSRSEVGSGYVGPVKTSYSVADSHIAPVAPVVAHAAPALLAGPAYAAAPLGLGYAGLGHGAGLGYGAGIVGGHGLGYGYGAGLGYGHGLGLGYGAGYGYGAGIVGGHGLGYGYGAGLGYGYGAGKYY